MTAHALASSPLAERIRHQHIARAATIAANIIILKAMYKLYPLWGSPIRMIFLVLAGLAAVAFAFFTLAVLLPIALVAGIALHFFVRHRLRKAQRQAAHQPQRPARSDVIEVEYTVIERR